MIWESLKLAAVIAFMVWLATERPPKKPWWRP